MPTHAGPDISGVFVWPRLRGPRGRPGQRRHHVLERWARSYNDDHHDRFDDNKFNYDHYDDTLDDNDDLPYESWT